MNEFVAFLSVMAFIPVIIIYCLIIGVLKRLRDWLDLKIILTERELDKF